MLDGWIMTGNEPAAYSFDLLPGQQHQGAAVAALRCVVDKADGFGAAPQMFGAAPQMFGVAAQMFGATAYAGQRMRWSAELSTIGVQGWFGLWMQVDGADGAALTFDDMADRALSGTTEWCHGEIVLDIPEDGAVICVGAVLAGVGEGRLARVVFEQVSADVPVTAPASSPASDGTSELPGGPVSLNFCGSGC